MCTGFIKKGADLIFGYNLDLALEGWAYRVYAKDEMFYIGIKVGSTVYKTHGVNRNGNFGNLPYMNDPSKGVYSRRKNCQRIDLLVDGYISGKRTYREMVESGKTKEIVNVPGGSMHALIGDGEGRMALIEPGLGCRELDGDFAVISNFPLLEEITDFSPMWYGKDRYDRCVSLLRDSGAAFSPMDGLRVLEETRQEGEWATRVSFVYSKNENAVYYVRDNDFSRVQKHAFRQ